MFVLPGLLRRVSNFLGHSTNVYRTHSSAPLPLVVRGMKKKIPIKHSQE